MKEKGLVSGKGAVAVGLAVGVMTGWFVGYLTYTQVITTFVGRRQIVVVSYKGFLQITQAEMWYDAEGNVDEVGVVVKNIDGVKAHSGNLTAGVMEMTPNSTSINLSPGEEEIIYLEITPPTTPGEEIMIFVGVEQID